MGDVSENQSTFAGAASGSATAQAITLPNMVTLDDIKGVPIKWVPSVANTGAVTLAINSGSATDIQKPTSGGLAALSGAELQSGQPVMTFYNGTVHVLLSINGTVATVTPGGYLTPTSGVPIITGDVTGATSIFYVPFVNNVVPIWNGVSFAPTPFSELELALTTTDNLASTIYDVFVFADGGIGTGPAWSNSGGGTSSRGSGAGTTQLTRVDGILVNAVQIDAANNGSTTTVAAGFGTYVGSVWIDSSAGEVSFLRSYGQSRKWGAWNCYNRVPIYMIAGDSTASWTYGSATVRPSNNNSANKITVFTGLAEEIQTVSMKQRLLLDQTVDNGTIESNTGIGLNSTTAFSGLVGDLVLNMFSGSVDSGIITATVTGEFLAPPALGINAFQALEAVPTPSGGTATFFGTETKMLLSAQYRG